MTSETNLREYIVTLHQFDDLESFYTDMETEGGDLYIPNRAVDVANRRPVSRNTHYMLSDQEAEQLRQDSRVLAVELTPEQLGIETVRAWSQASSLWNKSDTLLPGRLNWGVLRCLEGQQRPNWGTGGTTEVEGTATAPFGGKNVDVIIVDDTVDGAHIEFAKNSDGTGGSRFVAFDWATFDQTVLGNKVLINTVARLNGTATITTKDWHGLLTGAVVSIVCPSNPSFNATNVTISLITYNQGPVPPNNAVEYLTTFTYSQAGADVSSVAATGSWSRTYNYTVVAGSDYHGTFCTGIAAGNTQGWARDANIYNFDLFKNTLPYDYITLWHNAKSNNPATGIKNPSIINASYVQRYTPFLEQITSVNYRGNITSGPFTANQLRALGLGITSKYDDATSSYRTAAVVPARVIATETDIADCIAAGVIIVAAAGNEGMKIDLLGGADYNNTITFSGTTVPYNRGASPGAADNVINVGAIGTAVNGLLEEKATYSQTGPGIDVFAPGSNIRSSVPSNYPSDFVADTRNSSFKMSVYDGTSFASPQITGIIATMLEMKPSLTAPASLNYITSNAKTGQLVDIAANPTVGTIALNGAVNRYAFAAYPTILSITPSTAAVTPSQSVVYTITMTGALDGSLVYLTDSGSSLSTDFTDGVRQFVLTVNGGTASLTRTVSAGITASRTSILQLRTGGYDGNIQSTASTVTVSASDFASNSGSFTINALGVGSFSITPSLDSVVEGAETFTVSLRTGSISGDVVKTSNPITINNV